MGWSFSYGVTEKKDIVREITEDRVTEERVFKTLRKACRGNVMYALHESGKPGETRKWIGVYLLSKHDGCWGYKAIDESMGPNECDCPVKYLDEADEPINEYAREWRSACRARAEVKAKQNAKKPKVGEVWSCHGRNCQKIRITRVEGRRIEAYNMNPADYGRYRIPKRLLGEKLEDAPCQDAARA